MKTRTVPIALTNRKQWVTWRSIKRGSKATKVPFIAGTQRKASSVDADTWRTYNEASAASRNIGFVFTDDDPFVGIDLDDCIADGALLPWAQTILDSLPPTYTEVSPSGNGIKLWVRGELPSDGRRRKRIGSGQVEVYARGRYFTVTGQRWADTPLDIADAPMLTKWHADLFADVQAKRNALPPAPSVSRGAVIGHGYDGSDESLIQAARRSKTGATFDALWSGDTSMHGDDHSAADLALCNILAFWCGLDLDRIDRLFRQSGLMRDKWLREDYRDATIRAAIDGCAKFYTPRESVPINQQSAAFERAKRDAPFAQTDAGNAERMVAHFGDRICNCAAAGGWYVYDGKRWVRDDTRQVDYLALRTVRSIHDEADIATDPALQDALHSFAGRSESRGRLAALVDIAASMPGIAVHSNEFDSDPWLLNCTNGVVDMRTGELLPHDPKHRIAKIANAAWQPGATAPQWESFLEWCFHGNVELIEYVQEIIGICATGDIGEQFMPVFYGEGGNGKSVLIDTVMHLLGSYAGKCAPDMLMARKNESHPTEIADLWGLRMAVASEPEQGARLAVSTVKQMTGDATLKARYMRGDFFEFDRTHKLLLITNHKPVVYESKNAIWRRLKLVPFTANIEDTPERKVADLSKVIINAEADGVLRWIVEGAMRWHSAGKLDDPAEVRDATDAYRAEEDPISEFIDAALVCDAESFTTYEAMRSAYASWCAKSGAKQLSERVLFARLSSIKGVKRGDRRYVDGTPGVRGFSGLSIRAAAN